MKYQDIVNRETFHEKCVNKVQNVSLYPLVRIIGVGCLLSRFWLPESGPIKTPDLTLHWCPED